MKKGWVLCSLFLKKADDDKIVNGVSSWYIQGLNQGETELTFELYQDWNKEEINKTVKYIIEVK
ncbi:MAG: hypothetical protein U5K53_00135 [Halanaerobiales bacterium]|nr:hypothetical protein [Halanaerobiales bacterium]